MKRIPREAGPLLTALEQLAPHDHLCSIYESPEEHLAVAIPFIRIGLDRGEKCIYIADDGTEAIVRDAMHAEGIDVERAIATHSLVLGTKEATYLKNGSFDPEWMFTFWADATAEAMSQGFSALRATGETEWVLRGAPGLERWIEYESRLTHVLAQSQLPRLVPVQPPALSAGAHRWTSSARIPRSSIAASSAGTCTTCRPTSSSVTDQAAREVERLLTNIREREEIEYTLRQQRDELRRSEAYLRDIEARFRQIAENIREVLWVWDVAGDQITFVSPMFEEVFGRSRASLYANSRSFLDAIHIGDRARLEAAGLRARSGTPTDEHYRVIRPDGSIRWVRDRAFPVPEPAGAIERVVGIAEDITDRKRAEEALRRSERLLRLVLDALPVGVAVVDHSGDIILSNPASQRIWGGSIRSGPERYAESKGWWHATGKRLAPESGHRCAPSPTAKPPSMKSSRSRRSTGSGRSSRTRPSRSGTPTIASRERWSSTKTFPPARRRNAS